MKKSNKVPQLSATEVILKKIKNLKTDTIYSYRVLGNIDDKARVYLSRMADRGIIIKTGRGVFYKPTQRVAVKRSIRELPLNKRLFANDLFWNVRDGFRIKTDTLIRSYLRHYTQDDLMGLYSLFGYSRLVEEALRLYGDRRNMDYQKIRAILMQFETWRLGNDA